MLLLQASGANWPQQQVQFGAPCAAAATAAAASPGLLLRCSEVCLEQCQEVDVDCSSCLDTAEGFVVYQSPPSLEAPQVGGRGEPAGPGAASPPPPVLTEQAPSRLAHDPDLAEMLRCGARVRGARRRKFGAPRRACVWTGLPGGGVRTAASLPISSARAPRSHPF